MNREKTLEGSRFIALARCVRPGQIQSQLASLEAFGHQQGMVCIDSIALDGVSPSIPEETVSELIRRKQEQDDFDILAVQDWSRISRSGPAHTYGLLHRLGSVGVQVIAVNEGLTVSRGDEMQAGA